MAGEIKSQTPVAPETGERTSGYRKKCKKQWQRATDRETRRCPLWPRRCAVLIEKKEKKKKVLMRKDSMFPVINYVGGRGNKSWLRVTKKESARKKGGKKDPARGGGNPVGTNQFFANRGTIFSVRREGKALSR